MNHIDTVKGFVEGILDIESFVQTLYNNKEFQDFLSNTDFNLPPYAKNEASNLFYYLINKDYNNTTDLINIQGILQEFLNNLQVNVIPSNKYVKEKEREEEKKEYIYLNKKPKWLQGNDWVEYQGKPLLFIGQLETSKIRHDTSYLYIFYNQEKGEYITIEQSI